MRSAATRTGAAVLPLLLGLLPAARIAAQARAWPTTDWQVACFAPRLGAWNGPEGDLPGHAEYLALVQSMMQSGDCNQDQPGSPAHTVRELLREASRWLEAQGFPPPLVGRLRNPDRYEAFVIPWGHDQDPVTLCFRSQCVSNRPVYFFGGRPSGAEVPVHVLALLAEPHHVMHELFHAVQHSWPGVDLTDGNRWIIEGTAEAVARTWEATRGPAGRLPSRLYSEPLPRLVDSARAYDEQTFWRAASREYTGETDYRFLIPLFQQGLAGDGVPSADSGFARWGGLDQAFTAVVARHLLEDRFYAPVDSIQVVAGNHGPHARSVHGTVARIAADAWRVVARVVSDNDSELTIRFAEDHPDLRLVVDTVRYDTGPDRNLFRIGVARRSQPYRFFVRVVNVADDPVRTGDRPYELVVTLAPEVSAIALSGDVAIPETRIDRAAIMGIDRRSPEACQLAIGLAPSERYPAVSLSAILPAGLSVGRYAVGATGPGMPVAWRNELASPGAFFAWLQVPPEYGTIGRRLRSRHFGSTSGTIQVEHFDGGFVRLRFAIQFRENGVHQNPGPRTVSVEGVLAQRVERRAVTPGGFVVGDPSKAPSYIACERRSS